jgi:hypothetical protein
MTTAALLAATASAGMRMAAASTAGVQTGPTRALA